MFDGLEVVLLLEGEEFAGRVVLAGLLVHVLPEPVESEEGEAVGSYSHQ